MQNKHRILALTFVFISTGALRVSAQSENTFYIAPALSLGYTFAGGVAFGFDVDFGIWRDELAPGREFNTGFSYTHVWTKAYHDRIHNISAVSFMMETDYYDAKIGFGAVVDKHGYNHIVHCWAPGLYTDISFTDNEMYFPWIGMKGFWYNWNKFEGFEYPYITPYLKYKYDLFQRSGIKNFN